MFYSFYLTILKGFFLFSFSDHFCHLSQSSLKMCLSECVINMRSSENTYMTDKTGSLQIRQHLTGLPSRLRDSGLQSACQLVSLSHCIFLKMYTIPNCVSVDNTANITLGYRKTHVQFVTLFQFLCQCPVYSSKHPRKKSPVLSREIKVVTVFQFTA